MPNAASTAPSACFTSRFFLTVSKSKNLGGGIVAMALVAVEVKADRAPGVAATRAKSFP